MQDHYKQKLCFAEERNRTTLTGEKIESGRVALEYWTRRTNLGDSLAPVIYQWMLERNKTVKLDGRTAGGGILHLMTVGSIVNMGEFDAVVWGSGVLSFGVLKEVYEKSAFRRLDIRAVRGPITRAILENAGYHVPELYGDPGVLMPLIHQAKHREPDIPYTYSSLSGCGEMRFGRI